MTKRFTAVVKIIEVEDATVRAAGHREPLEVQNKRELIDIEVRAKDLDSMKTKLKAHIDLAEEL
jgi:predicted component of viral defense system (DUF524 family)